MAKSGVIECQSFSDFPLLKPTDNGTVTSTSSSSSMSKTTKGERPIFYDLSAEMILQIAHGLSDSDLTSFRISCSKVNGHITATGQSFFRQRFLKEFDYPQFARLPANEEERLAENGLFYDEYIQRRRTLNVIDPTFQAQGIRPKLCFNQGGSKLEVVALDTLKDLITEAFGIKGSVEGRKDGNSKNLDQIRVFLEKTNLFNIIGMDSSSNPRTFALPPRYYTEYLYAIQCTLAAELFALNKPWSQIHISSPDAQMMAYSDPITAPILFGPCGVDINFKWLLRNLQFWHQHLNHQNEVLTDAFEALAESDRPALFAEQLHDEPASLGRMWKGSYAFVDRGSEISNIRSGANLNQPIMDQLSGEGDEYPFQDLVLQFPEDDSAGPWPRAFERILHSIVMPLNRVTPTAPQHATSRISAQNFTEMSTRILGSGHDSADDFQADGWLNPLPPQHEIPGWQRFTLMKFFQHEDNGEIDLDNLWAYEGIVLPGGKIIVGRWWCPSDGDGLQMYSGPFILWNVADAPTSNDKGQSGYCKAEGEAKKKF